MNPTILFEKTLQIPAFFENVIPRPVGSFLLSGSSTLKRIWCLIQKQKNLVFQGSILIFFSSSASFFIPVYPRATFNRCKKKQFTSSTKIGQTPSLWQHLIKKYPQLRRAPWELPESSHFQFVLNLYMYLGTIHTTRQRAAVRRSTISYVET